MATNYDKQSDLALADAFRGEPAEFGQNRTLRELTNLPYLTH